MIWKAARGDRSRWIWHTAHHSAKKREVGGEEGRKQPILVGGGSCGLTDAALGGGGREDQAGHRVFCCSLGSASEMARWWPQFGAQEGSPGSSSSPLPSLPGPSDIRATAKGNSKLTGP